ncbi:MAG: YoaK family protein [Candidatus Chryseobacterium colombiense]|nr:YoaK family protein [Chryseobacterium sp.]WEK70463.1 MAG: YoaK family protein [Chryseobacterium sp.]
MELKHSIGFVTLLLAMIAGYCDTVTFVAAESIFSAHVTGNFIVFAYQFVKGSDINAWVKLLTFPVFILAVITGGRIAGKALNHYTILFLEGLLLVLAGILVAVLDYNGIFSQTMVYFVTMMTVFAMGLQNAFGKLYAKETHGPTTMMTGNVTQASLDFGTLLKNGFHHPEAWTSMKKQLITILGFLVGCFLGAYAGKQFGLTTLVLPGFAMIICYLYHRKNND